MNTMGLHTWIHDPSCILIEDGKLVSAVEEERFVGIKHVGSFGWGGGPPSNSINWVLDNADLKLADIEFIAYPYDLNSAIATYTTINTLYQLQRKMSFKNILGLRGNDPCKKSFYANTLGYFKRKKYINKLSEKTRRKSPIYIKHHLGHASAAFRCSGFDKANTLVADSIGEQESTSLYIGTGNDIEWLKNYPFSQSLGSLYRMVTYLLGLGPYSEGKTMALASYGKINPKFSNLIRVTKDSYEIDVERVKKLNGYARYSGELTQDHKDIAATLQAELEKACLVLVEYLYDLTGYKKLCLSGGVTFNCKMNAVLLNSEYVNDIFIQPSADDAGAALGAVLESLAGEGYTSKIKMEHSFLGPEYSNESIKETLTKIKRTEKGWKNLKYEFYDDIEGVTAELLSEGKIVGWFQDRMEFGPRALGNRSILANPTITKMNDKVNGLKHRERWRPLAPSVLDRDMRKYFENPYPSPFMIISFQVNSDRQTEIPAVVHVDGSARVQTVSKRTNPRYYRLIQAFGKETGTPMLLNTSFNDRGQPIVMSPELAVQTFKKMGLDYLAIGNYLVRG